jgi:elongation factor P
MYQTSDIRKNLKFKMDGGPWTVVEFQFVKPGKGTAFTRTKLKNLLTGQVVERNFRTGETFEPVDMEEKTATYAYDDGDQLMFMDQSTYEQFPVNRELFGAQIGLLIDNMECAVLFYEGRPVSVEMPNFVELKVTYCEPAVKGDTANNVTKQATVSTGATVPVPLFVNQGEVIRVDTRTGEYAGRASK